MKLTILHTNDIHSYLDNMARIGYLVKKIRNEREHVLVVDAGDSVSGSIYYNLYEGEMEAKLLSRIGYDVVTLGNHDFDRGSPAVFKFIQNLSVPIITSNVHFDDDPILKDLPSYLIKDEIGIFALTSNDTKETSDPSAQTIFEDADTTTEKMIRFLQGKGVKLIILLSHEGKEADMALAHKFPEIDIIVGGHSHDITEHPIQINETLIVQAGCYGKYVGELNVDVETKAFDSTIHVIDEQMPEDPQLKQTVDCIKREETTFASEKITTLAERLNGDRSQIIAGEVNLGNLTVDAFMAHVAEAGHKADIGIINGFGIRTSLEAGEITKGDLVQVMPFVKPLVLLECTGKQIKDALQYGLYPQVGGLNVTFDFTRPKGEQVTVLTKDSQPVDDNKIYKVVTNAYCASGKDGYDRGFDEAKIIRKDLGPDIDAVKDYLLNLTAPVHYPTDGRLTIIDGPNRPEH